ncbi:venom protease-like [Drosophila innubila]|uniref:venom protease-like n=1 Tax=Drosophila innubila TaxID=198719 RepID=UPI00148D3D3B|nr:venom protease-like [Drosophila innubila]
MRLTCCCKNVLKLKTLWLVFLLLLMLLESPIFAQDAEIVSSCTRYKQSVFDVQDGYSFLLPGAPITYKKLDMCRSYTPLIVGGKPAEPKEFPYMARLGNRKSDNQTDWFCGGTLITNHLVLTAAHCLFSGSGAINVVRLGELDFASDTDDAQPEDFGVNKLTEHPSYEHNILYNDIAIVQLDRGVRLNAYKLPACLPFEDGNRYNSFIATGWGHTKFAGVDSRKLLKVKLNDFGSNCPTADEIDELPNGFNSSTQLCIGSNERKDTCNGDSGGPVVVYHAEYPCMYHVMGVTSSGISCGIPNTPSLYTRVHFYLDWIKKEIAKLS